MVNQLSNFDYFLPKELIAQEPLAKRDSCRLMVIDRLNKTISHQVFKDLVEYLQPGDVLVLNDTKVIPARIFGIKKDTLGKVDVLLVSGLSEKRYQVLVKPHLKIGQEVIFNPSTSLRVNGERSRTINHGTVKAKLVEDKILEFNKPVSLRMLDKLGVMPLPPYIKREPARIDENCYQTLYAKNPGAIASPTAGLHFTQKLLNEIKNKSVDIAYLTLHVGIGTFKPVKCEDIREHIMEKEEFSIPRQTIQLIQRAKVRGRRIFAVGTTTTRAVETVADAVTPRLASGQAGHKDYTNLFIYPGYKFKVVDCLLTNFHLPKTTLLMLVCAFAGRDLIMQAYQEAIKERYRFYSYGDAMLII